MLFRLLIFLKAVSRDWSEDGENPLIASSLLYPIVSASLEVSTLKAHTEWEDINNVMADQMFGKGPKQPSIDVLFGILDDAWVTGSDGFLIEKAVRETGVEIILF